MINLINYIENLTNNLNIIHNNDFFYIQREKVYKNLNLNSIIKLGFHFDSDIYKYNSEGIVEQKPYISKFNQYIVNKNFKDCNEINLYLKENGKIPDYLELKNTDNKGYGIFSKKDIPEKTFLGFYQGMYRPPNIIHNNIYGFIIKNFDNEDIGYIDAENLTFSNWVRFINDGHPSRYNIEYCVHNYQVYIYTTKHIKKNDELVGDYGDKYWQSLEKKGVKKKD